MDSHLDFVFEFLRDLAKNNTRVWMHTRAIEKRWDVVQRVFTGFIGLLLLDMSDIEDTRGLKPKECIFRIWRGTRFSKDKTPCKTYLSAVIRKGGRNNMNRAAYYLQIEPGGKSFIGGGVYRPEPEHIRPIRAAIARDGARLDRILRSAAFTTMFGGLEPLKLKTKPRDYHSAQVSPEIMELLRHTSWIASRDLTDKEVLAPDFYKQIIDIFTVLKPFNDFLNDALQGTQVLHK